MCKELSDWTGDFKLRIRWDMDHVRRDKKHVDLKKALAAIQQLMKNPRVRPEFWAPKILEDRAGLALEKDDLLRLDFVQCESEPDASDPTVG